MTRDAVRPTVLSPAHARGVWVEDALVLTGLARSTSQAHRLLQQGRVRVNGVYHHPHSRLCWAPILCPLTLQVDQGPVHGVLCPLPEGPHHGAV